MIKKLLKGINYIYTIPYYASFRVGDVVRICNVRNLKKYENSKEPYMNKLAVVIGYSTKSSGGPMTFAVRLVETGDEYLLYEYLLSKTGNTKMFIPKFEEGEEVINKSTKLDAKWVTVVKSKGDGIYDVRLSKDNSIQSVKEKQLRSPTEEELKYKGLEQKLPELEGIF
jgi:hypothetical protein